MSAPPSAKPAAEDAPRRRRRDALRFVPLSVLATVVLLAVLTHRSSPPAPHVTGASLATPSSGSVARLLGPSPPPFADAGTSHAMHGGPRHTHRAGARGPRTPDVAYRVPVGGPVAAQVTASPDESTLYVATLAGELVALARADGARRWSVPLGERGYGAPLVGDDGSVFVGSDAKQFLAVSPEGQVRFRLETDGEADTSAAFGKDGAVVFAAGRYVYAARPRGDVAWRFAAGGKVFTSPAVTAEGLVIVGSQDDHVYALDPAGALAWKTNLGADVDGVPAVADDGTVYVGTDRGEVVALSPAGAVAWRTAVGGFVRGGLTVARNGDVIAGTYGPVPRVVRLAADGAVRGAFAIAGTGAREFGIHGSPLEDEDGVLYFGAQDDAVYAVGPDGAVRWRFATGADVDAPLTMLADGTLVVPSEDGTVTLLRP